MCIDMCMGMCMDMCTGMCTNMCMDMFMGMCMDLCLDTHAHGCVQPIEPATRLAPSIHDAGMRPVSYVHASYTQHAMAILVVPWM